MRDKHKREKASTREAYRDEFKAREAYKDKYNAREPKKIRIPWNLHRVICNENHKETNIKRKWHGNITNKDMQRQIERNIFR